MLAAPAEPGFCRERDFEHRRAVGENAKPEPADVGGNPFCKLREPPSEHFVVIAAERVARDVRAMRIVEDRVRGLRARGPVIEPRGNDANGARDEFRRSCAGHAVASHIIHFAVASGVEPVHELQLFGGKVGVGHADRLEAKFMSPRPDLRSQRSPIAIGGQC